MHANLSGRQLTFRVPGSNICAGGDYWWEELSPKEFFEVCGTWTASVNDPQLITGTHVGTFAYHLIDPPLTHVSLYCTANHQFALTKTTER